METIIVLVLITLAVYMGLKTLNAIINVFRKSLISARVQKMLEDQVELGLFSGDPVLSAGNYIELAWNKNRKILNGKLGKRPHSFSVVAYSLAIAIGDLSNNKSDNLYSVTIILGNVLLAINYEGHLCGFTKVDNDLIDFAMGIYTSIAEQDGIAGSAGMINNEV